MFVEPADPRTTRRLWRWLFPSRENDRPASARSQICSLIQEADLVAGYAMEAGLLQDGEFFDKVAAARELKQEEWSWSNPAVRELRLALVQSRKDVPFNIVLALRRGWRPQKDSIGEKIKTLTFVVASLALMFAVGYSTMTYNRGARLYQEISSMRERHPGLLFSRLERQIYLAERRLSNRDVPVAVPPEKAVLKEDSQATNFATAAGESNDDHDQDNEQVDPNSVAFLNFLSQDASFGYVHELSALDAELRLFEDQSSDFLRIADSQFYLPASVYTNITMKGQIFIEFVCSSSNMSWLSCAKSQSINNRTADSEGFDVFLCAWGFGGLLNCPSKTNPEQISEVITKQYEDQYSSSSASAVRNFCRDLKFIEAAVASKWINIEKINATGSDKDREKFLTSSSYLFEDALGINTIEIMRQNCRLDLNYISQTIPNLYDLQSKISGRLSQYSFIFLPALYGALGSLIYYIKRVIDPLVPNPPLLRMISRVAMGALAGMSLAWLWDGIFSGDDSLNTVGFGLFIFSFICGFSIDVFFTLLEQLVKMASAAVERVGTTVALPSDSPMKKQKSDMEHGDSPEGGDVPSGRGATTKGQQFPWDPTPA